MRRVKPRRVVKCVKRRLLLYLPFAKGNSRPPFGIENMRVISKFLSPCMKRSLKFISPLLVLLSASFTASISAQKPTPTPDETGPTKVFEVRLPVTVTADTKKKELISG